MPTLREMQATWNDLVPQAQQLGIRRVRTLNEPLETKAYREGKLAWLQAEIARLSSSAAPMQTVDNVVQLVEVSDISHFTFGVELEFLMPVGMNHSELARIITQAGVTCRPESYGHTAPVDWKLVTDGSLGDYTRGAELVSPVLRGSAGLDALTICCNVLKQVGCKITQQCGYHVHVGAQAFELQTFKNLVLIYRSGQQHIDGFMAPSRRGDANSYSASINVRYEALEHATTIEQVAEAFGQNPGRHSVRGAGRYKKLNFQSYWQHGTVEFRHHQGTVEADKAVNWAKLCMRMCAAAQEGVRSIESLDSLLDQSKCHPDEKAYFKGRVEFFRAQENRNQQRRENSFLRRRPASNPTLTGSGNEFTEAGTALQRRAFGQE